MFVKRFVFVFLLLAALSSFAGTAMAQGEPQQFVVVYVEFKPADTKAGSEVLEELAALAEDSSGVIRFDVLQQTDRPNFFALFEIWANAQTFADFQNSSATQAILTQLTPLLQAPLDQRPGNLLTGTVNPRSQHARARQIFVITHVDVDPQFVGQARPLLDTFVNDSLNDPEVQKVYTLAPTLVAEGKYNAYFVNTPYVCQPVFADALTKLYQGQFTAEQAHKAAVDGVKKLIEDWLTS